MKLYQRLLQHFNNKQQAAADAKAAPATPIDNLYNPVGASLNGVVNINFLEHRGREYRIIRHREYKVHLDGADHLTAGYDLVWNAPDAKEDKTLSLRVAPSETSGVHYRVQLLDLFTSFGYAQDFYDTVTDKSGIFRVDGDEFVRCGGVSVPYEAYVSSLAWNKGGPQLAKIKFWDFSRDTQIDGAAVEEYLYAEIDGTTGFTEVWRGEEVNAECIEVF